MADELEPTGLTSPTGRQLAAEQRFRRLAGWLEAGVTDFHDAIAAEDWQYLSLDGRAAWTAAIRRHWAETGVVMADQLTALTDAGISLRGAAKMLGISASAASRARTGADSNRHRKGKSVASSDVSAGQRVDDATPSAETAPAPEPVIPAQAPETEQPPEQPVLPEVAPCAQEHCPSPRDHGIAADLKRKMASGETRHEIGGGWWLFKAEPPR
jgi:hypothetical protein